MSSSSYISRKLRGTVAKRALDSCEYCLIPSLFGLAVPYHIDHIISRKHEGSTTFGNLAFSCQTCNLNKGSDLATYLHDIEEVIRLYNPRRDRWHDHFNLEQNGSLQPFTKIGKATIKLLELNHPDSIELRMVLLIGNVSLAPKSE